MENKRIHLLISGFVQGVGFRHFVRGKARELGLVGWVRNADNPSTGSGQAVEVVAEGEKEKLEQLIKLCQEGPILSEVKDINIQWQEGTGEFDEFEIR